jgi:hypothetical protein
MSIRDDSSVRIELALRGAQIAKCALELMSLSPEIAMLQICRIEKEIRETRNWLAGKLGPPI